MIRLFIGFSIIIFFISTAYGQDHAGCNVSRAIEINSSERDEWMRGLKNFAASEPMAVPVVHFEGLLPHQGSYDASFAAVSELLKIKRSFILWCKGGDPTLFDIAKKKMMRWVDIYKYSYNPIDESVFDSFFDGYYVIRNVLSLEDRKKVDFFISNWGRGYISRMREALDQRQGGIWENNWQSHRVKIVSLIALDLNDQDLLRDAEFFFERQVGANIFSDGETLDFRERDAINYVNYDLNPLLRAAIAASKMNRNFYFYVSSNGGSLAKAVDWLVPYVDGRLQHEEYNKSKVHIDIVKRGLGVAGFNGLYDRRNSADVFWYASEFDSKYRNLAVSLRENPPDDFYIFQADR